MTEIESKYAKKKYYTNIIFNYVLTNEHYSEYSRGGQNIEFTEKCWIYFLNSFLVEGN